MPTDLYQVGREVLLPVKNADVVIELSSYFSHRAKIGQS